MKVLAFVFAILSILAFPVNGTLADGFPDFITSNEDYYITRIDGVPKIHEADYRLEVTGSINIPRTFTLEELRALPEVEIPVTVECIGNSPGGPLLSTARWKGFLLYDFLKSLGIRKGATGVRYTAADGYFASHTLDQIRDNQVLAALYMNGVPIPPKQGFPLRILNPGYYGVKQPAWVTKIEVIDRPMKDYWEYRGWDCSPPIQVDSTIFFPEKRTTIRKGEPLRIGGAAFGGGRIKRVDLTADGGKTWTETRIVKKLDKDNVWVFWEGELIFPKKGNYTVNARATDIKGNVQVEDDPNRYDGTGDWPLIKVKVR